MKGKFKKVFIAFLSVFILLSSFNMQSSALNTGGFETSAVKYLSNGFGVFADVLVRSIAGLLPARGWLDNEVYLSGNFYTGTDGTVESDAWLCGFASESILPDDLASGKYNTAGYLGNMPTHYVSGTMDDQRISAVSLSIADKTAVFISLDGFGITGTNVRAIRDRLQTYAQNNGIISINITATHSHYCIDTHGLGTNMYNLLKFNLVNIISRQSRDYNSTNEKFMNGLFSAAEKVVQNSVASLSAGKLNFGSADISDLISDSRTPAVFDGNVNRLRFIPDDKDRNEIWLVNMGVHPTSLEMDEELASVDYPGAIVRSEKELKGADVAFFQGAQSGIYSDVSSLGLPEDKLGTSEEVNAYGSKIVARMLQISRETPVTPKMNIRHSEMFLPIENSFLQLACKLQMINNTVLNTTGRLRDIVGVTEIGYCELGDELAIALIPGEFAPELAFGGTLSAHKSWNGSDWHYEPLMNMASGRKLLCFGLTNDMIGYIEADNDYASTYAQLFSSAYPPGNDHYNEMLSLGKNTASIIIAEFERLINL